MAWNGHTLILRPNPTCAWPPVYIDCTTLAILAWYGMVWPHTNTPPQSHRGNQVGIQCRKFACEMGAAHSRQCEMRTAATCTKSHCDTAAAADALEVTPRMKIGTSCSSECLRYLEDRTLLEVPIFSATIAGGACYILGNNAPKLSDVALITITSSDIDRENCHYETHCVPENTWVDMN